MKFLNVDLEIESEGEPKAVISNLGEDVMVLYNGTSKNKHLATFELPICSAGDPDSIINSFCALVENFDSAGLAEWKSCYRRQFSIGYESGNQSTSLSSELKEATIKRVSDLCGSIEIMIYPPSE